MKWYQKIIPWVNNHPFVKGILVAIESSGYAALMTVVTDPNLFTKDGLKHAAVTLVTAIIVGVRMYLKQSTRKEWTPEEREQKLNGGSK